MIKILSILFCILPLLNWAQKNAISITDSSTIETKYFPDINSIRIFNNINYKDISYYTEYYLNTKNLKQEGIFDHGYPIGLWKEYSQDGKLVKETNYNDSIWCLQNRLNFKFFDLQLKMKNKSDSLIAITYSHEFFDNHVEWNSMGSFMHNAKEHLRWNQKIRNKPTNFVLTYDIRLDPNHIYKDMINIELDSTGRFIPNESYWSPEGFEKLPKNIEKTFKLNFDNAFKIARKKGLIENDTSKASTKLDWVSSKKTEFYNLNYKFYIFQKYKSEKIDGEGRLLYILNDYYNVWIFNPWTGVFVEKKKMISTYEAEQGHGRSSGLHDLK
jgi:hypothetical protein